MTNGNELKEQEHRRLILLEEIEQDWHEVDKKIRLINYGLSELDTRRHGKHDQKGFLL